MRTDDGFIAEAGFQESIGDCFGVCCPLPLSELLAESLMFGDTGGVTPDPGTAEEPGLVVTDIGPAPGPGLANFSGLEISFFENLCQKEICKFLICSKYF